MSERDPNSGSLIDFIAATVETMRDQMATKDQLAGLATKSDFARLEAKMEAEFAAVRGDIEQVHLRLDSI